MPGLYLLAALPLILSGLMTGRGAYDQVNYHEPTIRSFLAQWPAPWLGDYLSATTPGYHLVLAAVGRYVGASTTVLQLAGACFTLALYVLVARTCARERHASREGLERFEPVAACLPALASMYVLFPGIWLLPDNAGWLGVLGAILLALHPAAGTMRWAIGAGALLLALVLVRQSHLWAAAPLVLGAGAVPLRDGPSRVDAPRALDAARRAGMGVLASLPAVGVVAWFAWRWGGLTPPSFQDQYSGINLAGPAFVLALAGIVSLFFGGAIAPAMRTLARRRPAWLVLAGVLGVGVALVAPTTYSPADGRWTGLWNLTRGIDGLGLSVADRSLAMTGLSALGAIAMLGWAASLDARGAVVLGATVAGFAAAFSAGFQLWQRYAEPLVLVVAAVFACRAARSVHGPLPGWVRWWRLAGPAALAALLGAVTGLALVRAGPPERLQLPVPAPASTPPAQSHNTDHRTGSRER